MTPKLPLHERRVAVRGEATLPPTSLRHALRAAVPVFTLVALLCPDWAWAQQQPAIEARQVAASGPETHAVTEPAIAAGPDRVVAVFFELPLGREYARYATKDLSDPNAVWTEGVIDPDGPIGVHDVSIAYEPGTGEFLAAGKTTAEILTCRFSDNLNEGFGPERWLKIADHYPAPVDKPWIVAGDPNMPGGQEYYITYQVNFGGAYWYLRSIHSGQQWAWANDMIQVPDPENPNNRIPVTGDFCAQPAVYGDAPLYVAYRGGSTIYFLVGEDVDPENRRDPNSFDYSNPREIGVHFERLWLPVQPPEDPVEPTIPLYEPSTGEALPGNFDSSLVPYLTVDPSDPDHLYIIYHDLAAAQSTDVNVYLHKLTRANGGWTAGPRIKVNNDRTVYESDQFMPAATIDDGGYIHIIFYDDRRFTDPDPNDPNAPDEDQQPDNSDEPKFDAYYAYAPLDDLSFTDPERNQMLFLEDPNDPPALDHTLRPVPPKEYIGICWQDDLVWTAYTGTDPNDPGNDGVIWSSRIDWSPP